MLKRKYYQKIAILLLPILFLLINCKHNDDAIMNYDKSSRVVKHITFNKLNEKKELKKIIENITKQNKKVFENKALNKNKQQRSATNQLYT